MSSNPKIQARRSLFMVTRILIAVALAVPGIILAMSAMPWMLGEKVMFFGIGLAFALPVLWLISRPSPRKTETESKP
jgi:hypothetical protein